MFRKEKGQALVLMGLALITLILFAALAVDMGAYFAARREAQNAADAAVLAGTRKLVETCGAEAPSEADIIAQIDGMMAANYPDGTVAVHYVLESGELSGYEVGATGIVPCLCGNRAVGLDVVVEGTSDTYLARVLGPETMPVGAAAQARFGVVSDVGPGLYPITRRDLPLTFGQEFTLRVLDDADTLPGNFGWLTWDGQNNVPALAESLTPPGNSEIYFNPGTPENSWTPDYNDHVIAIDKWVQGSPGNKNGKQARDQLDGHIERGNPMIIPLYKDVAGQGSHSNYQVASFAAFQLLSYDLPPGHGGTMTGKFIKWVTNGDWDPTVACEVEGGLYSVKLSPR